jgi:plastocyanin
MISRRMAGLIVLAAVLPGLAAACALFDANDEPRRNDVGGAELRFEIVAVDDEFDRDEIVVPANTRVTIVLDNRDEGVVHNFSVYESRDMRREIFLGELFAGVGTREYTFETPQRGSYPFRCDVHPVDMVGTLTVE